MMIKSIFPFIAIGFFILALIYRRREAAASGWVVFAGYCCFETCECFVQGDYLYTTFDLLFLAFSLILAYFLVTTCEKEELFFSLTRIALITAVLYFPLSEFSVLGDILIHSTTKITAAILNIIKPNSVYVGYPYIYSTSSSYDV
jgi:exosortase/archaeosortase